MGQVSEFSLILATMGLSLGHIDGSTMGLITLTGLITIGISTYMILYSHWLYRWLALAFRIIQFRAPNTDEIEGEATRASLIAVDAIVFGLGRYGKNLARELQQRGWLALCVDFDPERIKFWHQRGRSALYGDLEDTELFHTFPLTDAQWVVSTIPGRDKSLMLLHALEHNKFPGRTALTADTMQHREFLLAAGADVVLLPFRDAAAEAAGLLVSRNESRPARASTVEEAHGIETKPDNG